MESGIINTNMGTAVQKGKSGSEVRDSMPKKVNKKNSGRIRGIMDVFQTRCCKAGLKITPQRIAIYKVLLKTDEHPSAEMVFQKVKKVFPNISLDTVNRTLLTLNEIGAAFVVEGSGDAKRFDGNMQRHQHFKCIKCKRIFDFHYKPFDNIRIPGSISRKFIVLRKTVYLEGICGSCRKKIRK
jgi:Fur family transcriptional regulator, peroxide stress response regulator